MKTDRPVNLNLLAFSFPLAALVSITLAVVLQVRLDVLLWLVLLLLLLACSVPVLPAFIVISCDVLTVHDARTTYLKRRV